MNGFFSFFSFVNYLISHIFFSFFLCRFIARSWVRGLGYLSRAEQLYCLRLEFTSCLYFFLGLFSWGMLVGGAFSWMMRVRWFRGRGMGFLLYIFTYACIWIFVIVYNRVSLTLIVGVFCFCLGFFQRYEGFFLLRDVGGCTWGRMLGWLSGFRLV